VKIIPLTEKERLTENAMSTNWVLANHCASFPLMYHWRVLKSPERRTPISDELSDVSRMVEFWDTSKMRDRIEALEQSEYSVVLFCEYIPYNLHDWLSEQIAIGESKAASALSMVDLKCTTF